MNTKKQLRHVERDLNGIIAAISQVSSRRARRARRVAQIATGMITGAATIGGMLMFISAFGSASTGTAIGALSGAAATSAQMYWIGSIFGVGAVAGAIILPVIGAVLGLIAVFVISRAVFGRPRKPEKMQEFEVRALFASLRLAYPITARLADDAHAPSRDELRVYAHEGLLPLCTLIGDHLAAPVNPTNETESQCQSFEDTLALLPIGNCDAIFVDCSIALRNWRGQCGRQAFKVGFGRHRRHVPTPDRRCVPRVDARRGARTASSPSVHTRA